jgi:hypothetical protein
MHTCIHAETRLGNFCRNRNKHTFVIGDHDAADAEICMKLKRRDLRFEFERLVGFLGHEALCFLTAEKFHVHVNYVTTNDVNGF